MAHSDKNILITPSIGSTTTDPRIVFSGADASTGPQNITLQIYPTNSGTLSFEGSAGQLLSISNTMTGTIFAANDVSGIPSIEALDTGLVKLAQYGGNVLLGSGTDNATDKLQVTGSINATSTIKGTTLTSTVATGTSPLVVTSSTMVANLNANYWNGNSFSSYLNQGVRTGDAPTFGEVYTNGWFRNNTANTGLYSPAHNNHWYPSSSSQWNIGGTNNSNCAIAFRPEGHQSTVRGYVYANTTSEIGFLTADGNWALRVDNSKNVFVQGTVTPTGGLRITDADIRSNATSTWTGDPGTQGKIQYHSNRWYIVADQSSDRIVQFRRNGSDVSHVDNSGVYQGASTSCTGNAASATSATSAGYVSGNNDNVVGRLRFYGEGGNSGWSNYSYALYQESGSWANPFPDLAIGFHTGIKIGAYFGYNGTRIYNNSDFATQIASFGDGDNNFRSYYNVIAYASDKRLKENVINIDNALEKVMKLNGVTFDWKQEVKDLGFTPTAWHECGVLAQEVEAVLPEAVEIAPFDYDWKSEDGSHSKSGEKYLTVKYEKLVPLLIEAMKEQQAQIEELKSMIKEMRNEV